MLRIVYSTTPRKLRGAMGYDPVTGHGFGPKGRIEKLRQIVTSLIRHERLEGSLGYLDETRGYVELLIQRAQKHGPHHKETMELADYWLNEKDLVPKLFEVLAPRYSKYETSFTQLYRLPTKYPGGGKQLAILELKGNPYPPVIPKQRDKRGLLTNILVDEMRKDYYRDKYQKQPPPPAPNAAASENTEDGSVNNTTDSNASDESKDSSMESENYHKEANLGVKAPNTDGTPV